VATGIDQPAHTELSAAEARISEVASRLRAQTGPKPIEVAPPRFQPAAPDSYPAGSQQSQYNEQAERAEQITAQAFMPSAPPAPQTVMVQPVAPQTHHYSEPQTAQVANDHYEPGPFIPPQAESPYLRHQRMPQVEDLPLPGQRQILAQRGQAPAETQVEVKRKGLLERLASFGLSRQEEEAHHAPAARARPAAPHPGQAQRPQLPAPGQEYRRPNPPQAPRPAQQSNQQQPNAPVRPVYQPRSAEEDQLEIPAFLRRQSN
jgi:cell division protein FtsZ